MGISFAVFQLQKHWQGKLSGQFSRLALCCDSVDIGVNA